jgi:hypothetical protein
MNSKINVADFLAIWEKRWGKLSPDWLNAFLKDDRVKKITTYPEDLVRSTVSKKKKLDEILLELEITSRKVKSDTNEIFNVRKGRNRKVDFEIKDIYEWLTRMNEAELDPDSTFLRLEIKSDKETCQNKRKFSTEKEALFALIKLEKVKGEMIHQLPYKCNICKSFHNTHLISRETLKKLLNRYKPTKKN